MRRPQTWPPACGTAFAAGSPALTGPHPRLTGHQRQCDQRHGDGTQRDPGLFLDPDRDEPHVWREDEAGAVLAAMDSYATLGIPVIDRY